MNTLIRWMLTCALLQAAVTYGDQDSRKDPASAALSPAEQLKKITEDFQRAREAADLAWQRAKTDDERKKISQGKPHWSDPFKRQAIELARAHPSDPAAVDALVWMIMQGNLDPAVDESVRLLRERHVESEKLNKLFQWWAVTAVNSPNIEPLLRDAMVKNPHRSVRGHARFSLAKYLKDVARSAEQDTPPDVLVGHFERVVEEFGDLPDDDPYTLEVDDSSTLADAAKPHLFELRNLVVGKTAPEIEGEDVDGGRFKLSDYRGKIIVIDFWGDW